MQMIPRLFLAAIMMLVATSSNTAQERRLLTLQDAILKAGTELAPQRLKGLQWIEGDQAYSHLQGDTLVRGTLGKSLDQSVVDLAALNAALPDSAQVKGVPPVVWEGPERFRFTQKGVVYTYHTGTGAIEAGMVLLAGATNMDHAPVAGRVAFTVEDDLFIGMPGGGKAMRVSNDGGSGIVYGKSVHRNEYGISKGTFWSPQGNLLAYYRMDESMVTTYPLEDVGTKPSTFSPTRYPMAGQASHHVTIGIYDVRTRRNVFLATGDPMDQYLTNISWSPDERHVHVVHLDRRTEDLRLVRYDAATGEPVATLLTEHDDKYLEPEHPAQFLKNRPDQYLWWSERDGWQHLYLYDVHKGLVRQLTSGPWVVKELLGTDPRESFAVVAGTGRISADDPTGATETHLYRVDLGNGRVTRLTREPGTHRGQLSSDGSTLIDTWSSTTVPARTVLRDARRGQVMKVLLDAADPLREHAVGTIELLTIAGEEGDRLNARLIKPSHFDPTMRYPVLIYVYNGPHVQLVGNTFLAGAPPWMLEAAERGYLVWTVDGHGSANRGRDFEQVVHRRLGVVEVKDQMHGVAYLKQLPFVDGDRIAVHGWSYGGHMTTAMLLRHPDVFKVGVAGGPVMDWAMYEVMYTERYMDTPEENPEGYAATYLPGQVGQLQADLLLITGGQDDVVLPQHSLTFIKACVDAGKPVDFFEYPGHGHNVRGKDRLHLMDKVLRYIDQRMLFLR